MFRTIKKYFTDVEAESWDILCERNRKQLENKRVEQIRQLNRIPHLADCLESLFSERRLSDGSKIIFKLEGPIGKQVLIIDNGMKKSWVRAEIDYRTNQDIYVFYPQGECPNFDNRKILAKDVVKFIEKEFAR